MLKTTRHFTGILYYIINHKIMSKKNIFLLAAGYIAWWVISSLYGKKKPGELKKELETNQPWKEADFKALLDNFIDVHQNLLEDVKTHVVTEENKEMFNKKKEELLAIVDSYKDEWKNILEELKLKWKDYLFEAWVKLEELYDEKKDKLDSLKEVAPEKVEELKQGLKSWFDDLKAQINKK